MIGWWDYVFKQRLALQHSRVFFPANDYVWRQGSVWNDVTDWRQAAGRCSIDLSQGPTWVARYRFGEYNEPRTMPLTPKTIANLTWSTSRIRSLHNLLHWFTSCTLGSLSSSVERGREKSNTLGTTWFPGSYLYLVTSRLYLEWRHTGW